MEQDRTLNDDALEREIEDALAVDPSPEFLARVRTRIANEPRAVSWRAWSLIGVGALAATVVLATVITWFERDPQSPLPSTPVVAIPTAIPAPLPQATFPPLSAVPATQAAEEPVRAQVERPVAAPEILIPPGGATALRVLIMNLREGRIDTSTWDEAEASQPIRELVIEPINIEPIPQLALLEGERPW